jgi:hypothetical protein
MAPLFLLCRVNHEVHDLVSVQCMVPLFLLCRVNHEVHDLVSVQFTLLQTEIMTHFSVSSVSVMTLNG